MTVHAALLHRQTLRKGIGAVRRCWHPAEDQRRFVRRDHPDVVRSLRAGERYLLLLLLLLLLFFVIKDPEGFGKILESGMSGHFTPDSRRE